MIISNQDKQATIEFSRMEAEKQVEKIWRDYEVAVDAIRQESLDCLIDHCLNHGYFISLSSLSSREVTDNKVADNDSSCEGSSREVTNDDCSQENDDCSREYMENAKALFKAEKSKIKTKKKNEKKDSAKKAKAKAKELCLKKELHEKNLESKNVVYGKGTKAYVIEWIEFDGKIVPMKKFIETHGRPGKNECHSSSTSTLKNRRVNVYGKGGSFYN